MPNLKCAGSLLFLLAKRTWDHYGGLRRQKSADSLLFLLAKRTRDGCDRLRGLEIGFADWK